MGKRIRSTFYIITIAGAVAACAPYNPNADKGKGDVRPSARWIKLTALSDFYGTYEMIKPETSQSEMQKIKERGEQLNCQTPTRIGNANLSRFIHAKDGAVRLDQPVLDVLDPNTKRLIPADEIWISSGPESPDGDCTDLAIPIFADRGTWKNSPESGLQYNFEGEVLRQVDEDSLVPDHLVVSASIKRVEKQIEIAVRYERKSAVAATNKSWKFKRLTAETSAGSVDDLDDDDVNDDNDAQDEPARPPVTKPKAPSTGPRTPAKEKSAESAQGRAKRKTDERRKRDERRSRRGRDGRRDLREPYKL